MKKWFKFVSFLIIGVPLLAWCYFHSRVLTEAIPEPRLKLDPRARDLSVDHALILMQELPGNYDIKTTRTLRSLDAVIDSFITEMCRSPESSRAISLVTIIFRNYIDSGNVYQTSDLAPLKVWIGSLRAFTKDHDPKRAVAARILLSMAYGIRAGEIEFDVGHYEANGGACEEGMIDSEGDKWLSERRIKYYQKMADDLINGILASKRLACFHPMCLSLRIGEMVEARAQKEKPKPKFYDLFERNEKENAYLSYAARDAEFRRRLDDLNEQWPYSDGLPSTQLDAQREQLRKKMQEISKIWFEFNIAELERMPDLRGNIEIYVNTFHAAIRIVPPDRVPCFERFLAALDKKTDPPDLLRPYRTGPLHELAKWYFESREYEKACKAYQELIATDPTESSQYGYKDGLAKAEKAIRDKREHFTDSDNAKKATDTSMTSPK